MSDFLNSFNFLTVLTSEIFSTVLSRMSERLRSSTQAGQDRQCLTLFTDVHDDGVDILNCSQHPGMSLNLSFSQVLAEMALKQGGSGLSIGV